MENITLIVRGNTRGEVFDKLQEAVDTCRVWSNNNAANLSHEAFQLIHLKKRTGNRERTISPLKYGTHLITTRRSVKMAGVIIDEGHYFKKHIKHASTVACSQLEQLHKEKIKNSSLTTTPTSTTAIMSFEWSVGHISGAIQPRQSIVERVRMVSREETQSMSQKKSSVSYDALRRYWTKDCVSGMLEIADEGSCRPSATLRSIDLQLNATSMDCGVGLNDKRDSDNSDVGANTASRLGGLITNEMKTDRFKMELLDISLPFQQLPNCYGHRVPFTSSVVRSLRGRHRDVKLENISILQQNPRIKESYGYFKVDDLVLDLIYFRRRERSQHGDEGGHPHGTETYAAPEYHRGDGMISKGKALVGRATDIWTLVCVLAEVVKFHYGARKVVVEGARAEEAPEIITVLQGLHDILGQPYDRRNTVNILIGAELTKSLDPSSYWKNMRQAIQRELDALKAKMKELQCEDDSSLEMLRRDTEVFNEEINRQRRDLDRLETGLITCTVANEHFPSWSPNISVKRQDGTLLDQRALRCVIDTGNSQGNWISRELVLKFEFSEQKMGVEKRLHQRRCDLGWGIEHYEASRDGTHLDRYRKGEFPDFHEIRFLFNAEPPLDIMARRSCINQDNHAFSDLLSSRLQNSARAGIEDYITNKRVDEERFKVLAGKKAGRLATIAGMLVEKAAELFQWATFMIEEHLQGSTDHSAKCLVAQMTARCPDLLELKPVNQSVISLPWKTARCTACKVAKMLQNLFGFSSRGRFHPGKHGHLMLPGMLILAMPASSEPLQWDMPKTQQSSVSVKEKMTGFVPELLAIFTTTGDVAPETLLTASILCTTLTVLHYVFHPHDHQSAHQKYFLAAGVLLSVLGGAMFAGGLRELVFLWLFLGVNSSLILGAMWSQYRAEITRTLQEKRSRSLTSLTQWKGNPSRDRWQWQS